MLSFTRKTDYALISLVHIAREKGQCCSAREIASHYGMPMPLLMNILKVLNQHGITRSVRGPRGGYQLAKSPEDITLYEIILAVDGPVALVHCLEKKRMRDQCNRQGYHRRDRPSQPTERLRSEDGVPRPRTGASRSPQTGWFSQGSELEGSDRTRLPSCIQSTAGRSRALM